MYNDTRISRVLKIGATHFDLVRAAPVAYLLIDGVGQIVDANHAAASLLNEESTKLIGDSLFGFLEQTYSRSLSVAIQKIMRSAQVRECVVQLFDGRRVRLTIHAVAINGRLPRHCLVALYECSAPTRASREDAPWQQGEEPETLPSLRWPITDEEQRTLIDGRLAFMHALQVQVTEREGPSAAYVRDESIPDHDASGKRSS